MPNTPPPLGPCAAELDIVYGELVRALVALGVKLGVDDPDLALARTSLDRLQAIVTARREAERLGADG